MAKVSPTQRAKRKERASSIHVDLAPYMGSAVTKVTLLNAGNHHYRLEGPKGGLLDYWPSTTRWSVFRSPEIRGQGLKAAMDLLEGLEPPEQDTRPAHHAGWVTIFCDGSYDKGVGGWGCWIKKEGIEAISRGGPFTAGIGSAQDAEVRAMANSLWLAVKRGVAEPGDTVMIQTDCVAVLAALLKLVPGAVYSRHPDGNSVNVTPPRRLQKTLKESEALAGAVRLIAKNRFKIILRHVKGHQAKTSSGRAWVNGLTDKLARQGLDEARRAQRERTTA